MKSERIEKWIEATVEVKQEIIENKIVRKKIREFRANNNKFDFSIKFESYKIANKVLKRLFGENSKYFYISFLKNNWYIRFYEDYPDDIGEIIRFVKRLKNIDDLESYLIAPILRGAISTLGDGIKDFFYSKLEQKRREQEIKLNENKL